MPLFVAGALKLLAKAALTSVVGPFVEEAREAAVNAAQNTIRGVISGKRSIEEWAEVVIKGVDNVKDRIENEGNLRYIGGKLKFAMPTDDMNNVNASFELYFLDETEQWHKADADTNIPASAFTQESLEEIRASGEISYDVE